VADGVALLDPYGEWTRFFGQLFPNDKWSTGGFIIVLSCPRRRSALATYRPTRWATRGAPVNVILCSLCRFWQAGSVGLVWRLVLQTGMWSLVVVPVNAACDQCSRINHAGLDVLVHMLVLDGAPQPLHEHVVLPCTAPIHAELATRFRTTSVKSVAVN
jgi:hypothetical protein